MKVTLNGKEVHLETGMSIAEVLRFKGVGEGAVAIEHNRNWVRREEWPNIILKEDDRVEVIQLMAGG